MMSVKIIPVTTRMLISVQIPITKRKMFWIEKNPSKWSQILPNCNFFQLKCNQKVNQLIITLLVVWMDCQKILQVIMHLIPNKTLGKPKLGRIRNLSLVATNACKTEFAKYLWLCANDIDNCTNLNSEIYQDIYSIDPYHNTIYGKDAEGSLLTRIDGSVVAFLQRCSVSVW